MPYTELLKWVDYFNKRPVGYQEDNRTFLLMKSFGATGNPEDYFTSLKLIKENEEKLATKQAGRVMPSGMFLQKMLKAKGGDGHSVPWEKLKNGKQN